MAGWSGALWVAKMSAEIMKAMRFLLVLMKTEVMMLAKCVLEMPWKDLEDWLVSTGRVSTWWGHLGSSG